jgi:hypothetical protein
MRTAFLILASWISFSFAFPGEAIEISSLRLIQHIPLPHVQGRIDHLAVDLSSLNLTSFLSPTERAVPNRGEQAAEIRVYETGP